ncbi:MAG: DUF5663 domain-containing protein [Patescibacteria group bacterium]
MKIPQDVRDFLESLLTDANMLFNEDSAKEEMIKELFARLDSYLATTIAENMPDEHLDAFIKMNEDGKTREEIEAFIKDKMPNASEIFAKAFADFRDMYLRNIMVSRNAPE